jgi:hypothetical protein
MSPIASHVFSKVSLLLDQVYEWTNTRLNSVFALTIALNVGNVVLCAFWQTSSTRHDSYIESHDSYIERHDSYIYLCGVVCILADFIYARY